MWQNQRRNHEAKQYQIFSRAIYKRDEHKCQWQNCGAKKKLQIHHIRRWADNPFLRYCVGNGIVLCKEHHGNIKGCEERWVEYFLRIIGNK